MADDPGSEDRAPAGAYLSAPDVVAPRAGAVPGHASPAGPPGGPGDQPRAATATNRPDAAAADADEITLFDAFGGRRGVLDSALPPLTFIAAYLAGGQDLPVALGAALVAGAVVTGIRLARRDTLRHALAGFAAVALAAFVSSRTGRPQDFFLPSLLSNAAAALAWAVSIWVRRPFLGLTVGAITRSSRWRSDPVLLSAYCRASWIWVGSFLVRVAVMTPLWLAGQTVALGLAKVALGWPMVLVVLWLSWLVVEPAQRATRAAPSGLSRTSVDAAGADQAPQAQTPRAPAMADPRPTAEDPGPARDPQTGPEERVGSGQPVVSDSTTR